MAFSMKLTRLGALAAVLALLLAGAPIGGAAADAVCAERSCATTTYYLPAGAISDRTWERQQPNDPVPYYQGYGNGPASVFEGHLVFEAGTELVAADTLRFFLHRLPFAPVDAVTRVRVELEDASGEVVALLADQTFAARVSPVGALDVGRVSAAAARAGTAVPCHIPDGFGFQLWAAAGPACAATADALCWGGLTCAARDEPIPGWNLFEVVLDATALDARDGTLPVPAGSSLHFRFITDTRPLGHDRPSGTAGALVRGAYGNAYPEGCSGPALGEEGAPDDLRLACPALRDQGHHGIFGPGGDASQPAYLLLYGTPEYDTRVEVRHVA